MSKQESIPVGCKPPACQLYELWSPHVSTEGVVPQMSKFEQVSSDGH